MNERNNNGRGIFYGVIGVATLVVAIIGATFAYFTASASNENAITGNMATINMGIEVKKAVDPGATTGLIPMSNNMVEAAVSATNVCVDDNGNAVCQIYKVTVTNQSTAGVFVDGFVALKGGSGVASDYTAKTANKTTMRWAQVFASGNTYTTAGTQDLGSVGTVTFDAIGGKSADGVNTTANPHNTANIRDEFATFENTGFTTGSGVEIAKETSSGKGTLTSKTVGTSIYAVIGKNYIRVSDHALGEALSADEVYKQDTDITSALVYNQQLDGTTKASGTVSRDYYFVVWLSETGTNQTAGQTDAATSNAKFFQGQVKFISAQGSEVSATFGGYTRVPATYTTPANKS